MADNVEAIALRLYKFIRSAEGKASSYVPPGIRAQPRADKPKAPILATYEECLRRLTNAQRGELDRILEIMSGNLGSPPER